MGVTVREKNKGSGIWWVFINHQGKRKARKVGSKSAANKVARRIEAKLASKELQVDTDPVPTFGELAKLWLETYIKPLRRITTYERYRDVLRLHINPTFGKKQIDTIKRSDVRNLLLGRYKKGLSKSSVAMIRDVTSGVMQYAIDDEIITSNPVTGITKKLNLSRSAKARGETLDAPEVATFLDSCLKHYPEHHPFFLCAFRTGMRLGELLALQWGDVDWHGQFIRVDRSFKNGILSKTKTGRTRQVDMSDQLKEALRGLYTARKREALAQGGSEPVKWIFHHKGQPWAQNSARNYFKRILRKAGLREIRFHDIRHTFASLLLSFGQSPVYVKEQLGHSSIQITVDIYGHLIPSSNRDAVNQLDQVATIRNLYATNQKEEAVTHEDYGSNAFLVPKGRLELPRLCRH
jgi:integrase